MNIAQVVKDRLSIKDVISKYLKLEKRGTRYLGLCPFHNEKTPSFSVSESEGFYHCFGCKKSGDVINFVMEVEKKDFSEVINDFANQLGIALPKQDDYLVKKNEGVQGVLQSSKDWFRQNLANIKFSKARSYFSDRSIREETVLFFELGFAPESRGLLSEHLRKMSFSNHDILAAGVAILDEASGALIDRFRNRVIFPIYSDKKQIIGFGGRVMDASQPKYLNSPETEFFKKKETLYNLSAAKDEIRKSKEVYVVEGYMDVISMHQAGFTNVVATLGTALTSFHLLKLWKYVDTPTICMDGDQAGIEALYRSAVMSLELISEGKSLNFVLLPEGCDPDDIIREKGREALAQHLIQKVDLSELIWNFELSKLEKRTPESIALFEKNIFLLANRIQNNPVKTYYTKYFKDKIWQEFKVNKKQSRNAPASISKNLHYHNISDNQGLSQENYIVAMIIHNPSIMADNNILDQFLNLSLQSSLCEKLREVILEFVNNNDINSLSSDLLLEFIMKKNIDLPKLQMKFQAIEQADYVHVWNIAVKKYLVNDIEKEYKKLVLAQDEESFNRAKILRDEIINLNNDIIELQSLIDSEEFEF
jgi:DNA primase